MSEIGIIPTGRINKVGKVLKDLEDGNHPVAPTLREAIDRMAAAVKADDRDGADRALNDAELIVRRLDS